MEKGKSILRWTLQIFFILFIWIFVLAYFAWFWVAPDSNFYLGLPLLVFYILLALLYQITKARLWIKLILLIPVTFVWIANPFYMVKAFPMFNTMAFYNKTLYVVTSQSDFFEPQYAWVQLRSWKWGLIPKMENLGHAWGILRFVYDKETKVVRLLRNAGGGEILVFTDDGKHTRRYEFEIEHQNHDYYLSKVCLVWGKSSYGYSCESYEWMFYQCDTNNISCVALPFKYTGWEWDGELEINDSTGEVDFIIWQYSDTAETVTVLVYSYGTISRCYVDGCEILNQPFP